MLADYLISIIYAISLVAFSVNVILIRRSNNKIDFILWAPIHFMIIVLSQSLICGFFYLLNFNISIINISIVLFVLTIFLFINNKKNDIQRYSFSLTNLLIFIGFFLVTVFICFKRFSLGLLPNFVSVDATAHIKYAYSVLNENIVGTNMFLSSVTEGLIMQFLSPFLNKFLMYKVFIICEVAFLYLSSLLFLSIVLSLSKKPVYIVGTLIFTLLYMLGYPLYVLEFGFSYLGISVSCVATIIFLWNFYYSDNGYRSFIYTILSLCLVGVGNSYTLFVPEVFLALFICVLIYQRNNDKVISKTTLFSLLWIFAFPVIFTLAFSFMNGSEFSSFSGANSGLAEDGGCFNDLYSSFVILLPLSIYGIVELLNEKKFYSVMLWLILCVVIFSIILFGLMLIGKASIYYCAKNSNLLWLLMCVLNLYAIKKIVCTSARLVCAISATLLILMGLIWVSFDSKLLKINERSITYKTENFIGIHAWNMNWLKTQHPIDDGLISLYENFYNIKPDNCKTNYIVCGDEYFNSWSVLSQKIPTKVKSGNVLLESVDKNVDNYLLLYNNDDSINFSDVESKGIVVYENDFGKIVKI